MGIVFNADEIFEMAEQIERNGAAFYRKAAEQNAEGRKLLLEIAEQEDQHVATFQKMREELTAHDTESSVFDPDGEGALYLKAMADGRVFDMKKKPRDILKGKENLAEIINVAIGMEKDSIVFYVGIQEIVPAELGKDRVSNIIREEMKHICWLNDQ